MDENDVSYSDGGTYVPQRRMQQRSGFAGALMRWGVAKDERQATNILLGVIIAAIAIGVGAWFVL